jgi:hypothetical protein
MSTPSIWNSSDSWEYQEYDYDKKCEVYYGTDGLSIANLYYNDTLITKMVYYLPKYEAVRLYSYLVNMGGKCDTDECKFKYGKAVFIKEEDDYYTIILISKE